MSRSEDPTTRGRGRAYQEPDLPTGRRDPQTQGRPRPQPIEPARDDPRYRREDGGLDRAPRAAGPAPLRTAPPRQPGPAPVERAASLRPQFDSYATPAPQRGEPRMAQQAPPRAASANPRWSGAAEPPAIDDGLLADRARPAAPLRQAAPQQRMPAGQRPQSAARPEPRYAAAAADRRAPAPAAFEDDLYDQQQGAGRSARGYDDNADGYRDQGYESDADEAYAEGEYGEEGYDEEEYEEERPRSRRGLIVVGALVAAIAIGGGLGFVYKITSEGGGSGKPKVVAADKKAVKSQPAEEGGQTFDGSGKQVYERLGGTTAADEGGTSVASSEESLIDRDQGTGAADGGEAISLPGIALDEETAAAKPKKKKALDAAESVAGGEDGVVTAPRKVQPVLVKPGETITDESAPLGGLASEPSTGGEVDAATAPAVKLTAKKAAAKAAATAEAAAADDLSGTLGEASGEQPVAAEKTTTKKKQVASAPAASEPAATETSSTAAGGYVVQVRATTSRMDALGSFADMQQKHGDLLASAQPDIQEFAKGDQTWYRLRIGPPGSKQAASTLCGKLKASGLKECIVTKY